MQRDQVIKLAKSDTERALKRARKVKDPWFRAQAYSWVARYAKESPKAIAAIAASAARKCDDDYKRSAVRAWEIAALAEREFFLEARAALRDATKVARRAEPGSSRCEALLLLLQAAFAISRDEAEKVGKVLAECGAGSKHWRCKRAIRDASEMLDGIMQPRPFFW